MHLTRVPEYEEEDGEAIFQEIMTKNSLKMD
jgi:hypothetical protein